MARTRRLSLKLKYLPTNTDRFLKLGIQMRPILHILLTLIFFTHHYVWATKPILVASSEVLEQAVAYFNLLAPDERFQELEKWVKYRPVEDQEFFKLNLTGPKNLQWPNLKLKEGVISFEMEGRKISLDSFTPQSMKLNGASIDFGETKLATSFTQIEKVLLPRFTFIDLFMPNAHALEPITTLYLIGALIVLVGVLVMNYYTSKNPVIKFRSAKMSCNEIREILEKLEGEARLEEKSLKKIRPLISKQQKLIEGPPCDNYSLACDLEKEFRTCMNEINASMEALEENLNSPSIHSGHMPKVIKGGQAPSTNQRSNSKRE